MRSICIILIALALSCCSLSARAVAKSHWMDGQILVIEFNGKQQRFLGWNDNASYYWEHGTFPSVQASSNTQLDSVIDAINNHRSVLNSHAQIINSQTASIKSLIAENKRISDETARLRNLAFTRVWTDVDGNSFMGVFIEYNLGAVKVQKVLDKTTYTIPAGRLTPACKEMALALNKFK